MAVIGPVSGRRSGSLGGHDAVGQPQVRLAPGHGDRHVVAAAGVHVHVQAGPAGAGRGQAAGQHRVERERSGGQAQQVAGRCGGAQHVGAGRAQAQQQRIGVFQQAAARRGGRDGAAGQQRQPQVALQRGDLLGDGRLGVAELGGGGRERAVAGDGDERGQQMRVH
ncbi:hypothetical protein GCM10020001_106210 [Nonomuraea salmonea]